MTEILRLNNLKFLFENITLLAATWQRFSCSCYSFYAVLVNTWALKSKFRTIFDVSGAVKAVLWRDTTFYAECFTEKKLYTKHIFLAMPMFNVFVDK